MESPLSILRKYVVGNKAITMRDGYVQFGDEFSWPEDVKTNWIEYSSDKNGAKKEYYTLKTLVFFIQNINYQHSAYVRQAVSAKIRAVRRPDRRALLGYLRGEILTCQSIDKLAPLENFAPTKSALIPTTSRQVGEVRKAADDGERDDVKKARYQADAEKLKAQLAAKLSDTKENCLTADNLKSLSEAMTVERIAAIKAKRLVKKRTTITSSLDEILDFNNGRIGPSKGLVNDDPVNDIIARERNGRPRNSMLQSKSKEFATNVFAILDSIKEREASKKPGCEPAQRPLHTSAATSQSRLAIPNNKPQAYNRYGQERFAKVETTSGFEIQTTASYHGSNIQELLSGGKPQVMQPPVARPTTAGVPVRQKKRPSTTPIIIVPSSAQSLITTLNATDILQELRFVSNDEKQASGKIRESEFLIQRRKSEGLTVPYRIVDNPLRLKAEDWTRVVAVFVLGPAWQFKGWPVHGGDPVNIFSHITAFHLKYDDMPVDANVARWAVTTLNISRTKRHLDRSTLLQFWKTLDKGTIKKRTQLRL